MDNKLINETQITCGNLITKCQCGNDNEYCICLNQIQNNEYTIIFLDIDGVLYYNRDTINLEDYYDKEYLVEQERQDNLEILYDKPAVSLFNNDALFYLNLLIERIEKEPRAKCGIVLSSTWRSKGDVLFLKDLFKEHYFSGFIIDKTVEEYTVGGREDEIKFWLKENTLNKKYNVKNFIILDDVDFNFIQLFPNNFVKTHSQICFDKENYEQCLKILGFGLEHCPYPKEIREPSTVDKTFLEKDIIESSHMSSDDEFKQIQENNMNSTDRTI